jgi:hypothetical protein
MRQSVMLMERQGVMNDDTCGIRFGASHRQQRSGKKACKKNSENSHGGKEKERTVRLRTALNISVGATVRKFQRVRSGAKVEIKSTCLPKKIFGH